MMENDHESLVAEEFPDWLDPMLATLVGEAFSDEDWIFERKLDGERCLAYCRGGRIRLMTRNEKDLVDTYPEISDWLRDSVQKDMVVDGEVVAFEGSTTSFQRLQPRLQIKDREEALESDIAVYYYLFDLLHLDGSSTRQLPLRERKQLLRDGVDFSDPVRFTPHRNAEGEDYFTEACAAGWEGLIAKVATSHYIGSRSHDWLKFKCVTRQEFVIGGYTDPEGERSDFGALLIGYYDDGDLVYAGKVGTGYDAKTLHHLGEELRSRQTDEMPFRRDSLPDAHWVEPELVAEIGFSEWTSAGRLRHPRFIGLRDDKAAEEVVRETPQ